MAPDDVAKFEVAIRSSSSNDFAAIVNPLDESTRKDLLKIVKKVRKEVNTATSTRGLATAADWNKHQAEVSRWQSKYPFVESNVAIGMLACGSAADAHRVQLWNVNWESRHLITSILIARHPKWLGTWVEKHLDGEFPDLTWESVREFLKAGVIEKPVSDGYTTLFIDAMRGYDYQDKASYVPTSARLKREPEFLDDEVWRIFEFENHALTTDWSERSEGSPENYESWPQALLKLTNDGDLDRDRLLRLTLNSMLKEFKQNQLSAFGKLHQGLKPTVDEIELLQQHYFDLLVSPTGPVLSFAISMLDKLHKAGKLNALVFCDSVRPVFAHKAKGTAMRALKILAKLSSSDSAMVDKIAGVATSALVHPSPDVQEAALGILQVSDCHTDPGVRAELERHIPFLSSKLQQEAKAIVGETDHTPSTTGALDQHEDLRADLQLLSPELRNMIRYVDGAESDIPAPLEQRLLDAPCVAERVPLDTVGTRDSLLELAARLLERVEFADQVEILLHGILRFGCDRSGNFEKLAAPLAQRIEKGETSSDGLCAGGGAVSVALADLLMTWFTGQFYDSRRTDFYQESPQSAFAVSRIRELQDTLLGGQAMPLLSLPSYRNGWLDPLDFAQRLVDRSPDRHVLDFDLMQALLRLGPGNRKKALRIAGDIAGKVGRVARFALGGDEQPKWTDRSDARFWYCAARARLPQQNVEQILGPISKKVRNLPGAFEPIVWNWSVAVEENNGYRHSSIAFDEGVFTHIDLGNVYGRDRVKEAKRKLVEPNWSHWPTLGLRTWPKQRWAAMYQFTSAWGIQWLAMQHPSDTESFVSLAIVLLDFRIDENTSRDTPVHAFTSALFDPTRPWGEASSVAVCLGLLSRSTDSRGFAIDALVPAIESGRAELQRMADAFSKLLDDGVYKLNRFAPALSAVLDVSDLHKWWVGSLVDKIVTQLASPPKNTYFLYELALDCMLSLQVRPSEEMLVRLSEHKGASKTAKLAKELRSVFLVKIRAMRTLKFAILLVAVLVV